MILVYSRLRITVFKAVAVQPTRNNYVNVYTNSTGLGRLGLRKMDLKRTSLAPSVQLLQPILATVARVRHI